MMEDKKYSYEELLEIIRTLRSENGCPWDREQTHMSLRSCLMEEAAETTQAIKDYDRGGDCGNLVEELGDVLLQVVMHARIGEEEGRFTMADVIDGVARKMVRRHPHVFAEVTVEGTGQVLENWEEIKKKEKAGKAEGITPLKEIPLTLPALTRAGKALKKADKLYAPQDSYQQSLDRIIAAATAAKDREPRDYDPETEAGLGDILMACANIARICRISPEQVLNDEIDTLIERFEGTKI